MGTAKGCLKLTAISAALLIVVPVGSCHAIRFGEMTSKADELPFKPAYFDFVAWDVCDRLFGGVGYAVRIPSTFAFDRAQLEADGWVYETIAWDYDGMSGLMCLESHQVDGINVPIEAFGRRAYARYRGRAVDYMVPSLRIGFGGEDPPIADFNFSAAWRDNHRCQAQARNR